MTSGEQAPRVGSLSLDHEARNYTLSTTLIKKVSQTGIQTELANFKWLLKLNLFQFFTIKI